LTKNGGMSLVLFTQTTNQPTVTEALLAICDGRGEQTISQHKAAQKAIELSSNVRKAHFIQGGEPHQAPVKRQAKKSVAPWIY
jgi:hypothetical protein